MSSTLNCAEVVHVSVGPVAELPFRHGTVPSGIAKRPVHGPVQVGLHGLVGDAQGDTVRHGGPDKALLAYAAEHYSAWCDELGPLAPAAFGENLTTLGLLEETVVLGDVYAVGTALLQATQPRRPCYKLGAHLARPDLPRLVQETGRTGLYLRVLREGQIAARNALRVVHRPRHGLTAAQVHHTMNVDRADLRAARRLLHHADLLPESWVRTLTQRLAGVLEDQTDRLSGPQPSHRPPHLQTPPPPGTTRGCP